MPRDPHRWATPVAWPEAVPASGTDGRAGRGRGPLLHGRQTRMLAGNLESAPVSALMWREGRLMRGETGGPRVTFGSGAAGRLDAVVAAGGQKLPERPHCAGSARPCSTGSWTSVIVRAGFASGLADAQA